MTWLTSLVYDTACAPRIMPTMIEFASLLEQGADVNVQAGEYSMAMPSRLPLVVEMIELHMIHSSIRTSLNLVIYGY